MGSDHQSQEHSRKAEESSMTAALPAIQRFFAPSHRRWLIAILIVALVLRVGWILVVQPDPRDGRIDDSVAHYYIAQFLADGYGFVGLAEAGARDVLGKGGEGLRMIDQSGHFDQQRSEGV